MEVCPLAYIYIYIYILSQAKIDTEWQTACGKRLRRTSLLQTGTSLAKSIWAATLLIERREHGEEQQELVKTLRHLGCTDKS